MTREDTRCSGSKLFPDDDDTAMFYFVFFSPWFYSDARHNRQCAHGVAAHLYNMTVKLIWYNTYGGCSKIRG